MPAWKYQNKAWGNGMELTVKLESFEGPLDLLLHLLEKNKVNILSVYKWS